MAGSGRATLENKAERSREKSPVYDFSAYFGSISKSKLFGTAMRIAYLNLLYIRRKCFYLAWSRLRLNGVCCSDYLYIVLQIKIRIRLQWPVKMSHVLSQFRSFLARFRNNARSGVHGWNFKVPRFFLEGWVAIARQRWASLRSHDADQSRSQECIRGRWTR